MTVIAGRVRGQPIELHEFDGKLFRFVCVQSFAPGQPLVVEAALASSQTLELKSIGSVKLADGRFEVRARAATLSRPAREALLVAFPSAAL
jgi:hypothetical protein